MLNITIMIVKRLFRSAKVAYFLGTLKIRYSCVYIFASASVERSYSASNTTYHGRYRRTLSLQHHLSAPNLNMCVFFLVEDGPLREGTTKIPLTIYLGICEGRLHQGTYSVHAATLFILL